MTIDNQQQHYFFIQGTDIQLPSSNLKLLARGSANFACLRSVKLRIVLLITLNYV